ncbi:hypothetical protein EMPS_11274 [Entomortierella parvispora]|uniref:Glutathione S-transferase n=1 Tax=Entomortierella parvispora TaxID=205924 RepID=A0A9P3HLE2_9FUNG|nr:hypothetical protein EMPS_11274 [Entomortierella parvispora]
MVSVYPSSNSVSTAAEAAVLDDPQASYSLLYFDTEGICGTIRNLFALGGATWKQLYPQDWENADGLDKASTPFCVLPVLYVHSRDGSKTVQMGEVKNIELYLAEKFGYLGKNTYERYLIGSFVSSTSALWDDFNIMTATLRTTHPEVMADKVGVFMTEKVPKWIKIHEEHLAANGQNGHYVGNQLSLADLRSGALLGLIQRMPQFQSLVTPETAPGLLKVQEAIDQNPKIQAWRESELCKSLRVHRAYPPNPRHPSTGLNDRKGNKVAPTGTHA